MVLCQLYLLNFVEILMSRAHLSACNLSHCGMLSLDCSSTEIYFKTDIFAVSISFFLMSYAFVYLSTFLYEELKQF